MNRDELYQLSINSTRLTRELDENIPKAAKKNGYFVYNYSIHNLDIGERKELLAYCLKKGLSMVVGVGTLEGSFGVCWKPELAMLMYKVSRATSDITYSVKPLSRYRIE